MAAAYYLKVLRAETQPGKSPSGHEAAVALEVQPADRSLAASGIVLWPSGQMESHQEFIGACNLERGATVPAGARTRIFEAYLDFLMVESDRIRGLRAENLSRRKGKTT